MTERGSGAGEGSAVNVPLPAGTGDGGYLHAFDQVVAPALRAFGPEVIRVASGFDGSAMDPLARQMLTSEGYRSMTNRLKDLAAELCGGRIAMVHEGGYSPQYVPFCGLAVLEALSDAPAFADPFLPVVSGYAGQELQPHQAQLVAEVAALLDPPRPD